ncbi:hypothetical protein GXM_03493 [Nostoc sphaeroides CCNUC1]|uniref:Uncharacterized protein n=1 Tax=Nostoc sphaeroides CCNUC1 TaxID=2653204 RepID=A0A5P8W002_9NOSO|nr:hypothetical protein GXM_03493 [Nostoc sphaeroides CCNUC1]
MLSVFPLSQVSVFCSLLAEDSRNRKKSLDVAAAESQVG